MKVGIISDSHDDYDSALKAAEIFTGEKVGYILHAGDIIAPFCTEPFLDVEGAKFIAVVGNNKVDKPLLKKTVTERGGEIYDVSYEGEIAGRRIFMVHVPDVVEETAASGKYDLVIYGHTHRQDIHKVGNTLVVNPGKATDWFWKTSSVVVVELDDMSYKVIPLS